MRERQSLSTSAVQKCVHRLKHRKCTKLLTQVFGVTDTKDSNAVLCIIEGRTCRKVQCVESTINLHAKVPETVKVLCMKGTKYNQVLYAEMSY